MSDSPEYILRWRGRQSGPFPLTEINRMLDDHKIGLGHEILYQDQWITVEEFLAALPKEAPPTTPPAKAALPTMPLGPASVPTPITNVSPLRVKVSVTPAGQAGRGSAQNAANEGPPRSRLVFALLAVFAGFSGAHNFYARQWMTGMLQLLLSVATSLMSFGIIASWLWAIVEAVVVRRDGQGNDMI